MQFLHSKPLVQHPKEPRFLLLPFWRLLEDDYPVIHMHAHSDLLDIAHRQGPGVWIARVTSLLCCSRSVFLFAEPACVNRVSRWYILTFVKSHRLGQVLPSSCIPVMATSLQSVARARHPVPRYLACPWALQPYQYPLTSSACRYVSTDASGSLSASLDGVGMYVCILGSLLVTFKSLHTILHFLAPSLPDFAPSSVGLYFVKAYLSHRAFLFSYCDAPFSSSSVTFTRRGISPLKFACSIAFSSRVFVASVSS